MLGVKRKNIDEGEKDYTAAEKKEEKQTDCLKEERAEKSGPSSRMKSEVRLTPILVVVIYRCIHTQTQ